ncbi:MAG: hypothetical protein GY862_22075, partial [Gammaproteobacteria bacterium]|nr:hypothetical protein [Gammaproteobacteria bacterium]
MKNFYPQSGNRSSENRVSVFSLYLLSVLFFVCSSVQADIQILTGTGGIGVPDPRFAYTETGDPAPVGISAQAGWLNPATGAWIAPADGSGAAAYTYAFTLESAEGASLSGDWAGGSAMKISLNGQLIASGPDQPAFDAPHPFSAYAAEQFTAGVNILRFETGDEAAGLYVNAIITEEDELAASCLAYQDAFLACLRDLDGVDGAELDTGGFITITMSGGEVYQSKLAESVTAGEAPADGQFQINPAGDIDGNGIEDFEVIYPGGERQIIYYLGMENPEPGLPPDPALVAPPIDPTVPTLPYATMAFLYTGSNPIQTGVASGTIEPRRAAVIRGKISERDGQPLSGATVTILNHPEYGQTFSRADGMFDLAVNGGVLLTVNYQKTGYLPAQRKMKTPWQDYVWAEDVVMIPFDPRVTPIDLTANLSVQAARGSVVTDADGTRQATVLFPQGVTAAMTLSDGSVVPLEQLDVRATEYSVGENGLQAMPAPLPPASAYTYAVELSADQAVAAGAARVDFSRPLPVYVDNFLNFPVGDIVPAGWYDHKNAAWIPSDNGRVIQILSIGGGIAELDVDGSGTGAGADALAELGIAETERELLAALYAPGKSLWRAPISHFTPWDFNWPYGPPYGAVPPSPDEADDEDIPPDPCEKSGCIITAESQVLGESIPVTGTSFSLNYSSGRVPGRSSVNTLKIPLRGSSVPDSLKRIVLEVSIAGQRILNSFSSDTHSTVFVWDGKDAFGRRVRGRRQAKIRIGYMYEAVYYSSPVGAVLSFGRAGVSRRSATGNRARKEVILWKEYTKNLGAWHSDGVGLGGLSLNIHHVYDSFSKILYRGDGGERSASDIAKIIDSVEYKSDLNAWAGAMGIAFGPEGNLYVGAGSPRARITRLADGLLETVAGTSGGTQGFDTNKRLAKGALVSGPDSIAFAPDGNWYFIDGGSFNGTYYIDDKYFNGFRTGGNNRVRRIDADGFIDTVAGTGEYGYGGDGGPAKEASFRFSSPAGIAVAPDGSLYIADSGNHRIRRITLTDGIIDTIAGNGQKAFSGDGGPATGAALYRPSAVAFGPDGNLYIADKGNSRIRRVTLADGIIATVAGGGGQWDPVGDGGPATEARLYYPTDIAFAPDGSLYIADTSNHRIRQVNTDGIITTIVGNGQRYDEVYKGNGDGGPATATAVYAPGDIAVSPDGDLYFRSGGVRRASPALPSFSLASIIVPSEDGGLLYEFISGHHQHTLDALTGQAVYTFSYNERGYLTEIKDLDGDITRIERDDDDAPLAITAPDGQRTVLTQDANAYLNSIANPENEVYELHYSEDGLLERFIDPRKHESVYRYDDQGRLIEDIDAVGGGWTLARADHPEGAYTVAMTSREGRVSSFKVEPLSTGDLQRTNTAADGTVVQTLIKTNGETRVTRANGTVITSKQGPDPRFGMQAPVTESLTVSTPGGLTTSISSQHSVTLNAEEDLSRPETVTTATTVNGRTSTSIYDAAAHAITYTSPENRQSISHLDAKGRVTQTQTPGLTDVFYTYDDRGRLTVITEGEGEKARITTIEYDPDSGYVAAITDTLQHREEYTRDAVGRILIQTLPDTRQIGYTYDLNGNIKTITPPGRPAHGFEYTETDLQREYIPPVLTGMPQMRTQYIYNPDKQLTRALRPDGQNIDLIYDPVKGRLNSIDLLGGRQIVYTYYADTSKLETITAPDGSRLRYIYDGSLPLSEIWENGSITGALTRTFDNNFRLESNSVNDDYTVHYQYDNDGLLTRAGDLVLNRDTQSGFLTDTVLGGVATQRTFTSFGELETEQAGYQGQTLYRVQYSRDKLSRIVQKTETMAGETIVHEYRYNLAGQLREVMREAVSVKRYGYDSNGNRIMVNDAAIASYDEQDRMTRYGEYQYAYTENGELKAKTNTAVQQTTSYTYDVFGALTHVQFADGTTIEYLIDGRDRRIGKKVNGLLAQGFLYQGSLNPAAELDANGNVVTRFV